MRCIILFFVSCITLTEWPKEERSRNVTQLIREKLPEENYELFKYIVEFLVRVSIKIVFEFKSILCRFYIYTILLLFTVCHVFREYCNRNKMQTASTYVNTLFHNNI